MVKCKGGERTVGLSRCLVKVRCWDNIPIGSDVTRPCAASRRDEETRPTLAITEMELRSGEKKIGSPRRALSYLFALKRAV